MKKFLFPFLIAMIAGVAMAQTRIAVIDFNSGVGVRQSDVSGLSSIFTTSFSPSGCLLVERLRIQNLIKEQRLQRSNITEREIYAEMNKVWNVKYVVIGDVNLVMGEYNVDVRAVDAKTGSVVAKAGKAFTGNYRTNMSQVANELANKISRLVSQPVAKQANSAPQNVAPTYPKMYGHEYVDLGLSVKWATCNVGATVPTAYGKYFSFGETSSKDAYTKYTYSGDPYDKCEANKRLKKDCDAASANWGGPWRTPTRIECEELANNCTWKVESNGYSVTGPSGKSIFLPFTGLAGYSSDGEYGIDHTGTLGLFMSSTYESNNSCRVLSIEKSVKNMNVGICKCDYGMTVRPVF